MQKSEYIALFLFVVTVLIPACIKAQQSNNGQSEDVGTFGYDLQFLLDYTDVIVLSSPETAGKILITPTMQGRVMTSTIGGDAGISLGWVNHELIASGEILKQFTPYGGEDRFWIAPEGGQYSVFITPGKEMIFENWYVPPGLNTEPWHLAGQSDLQVNVEKNLVLQNYSNVQYEMHVDRTIKLLGRSEIESLLGITIINENPYVAYETENTIQNTGLHAWTKDTGAPAIWILNMFSPSPGGTVVIPFKTGDPEQLGPVATTDIFGEITEERLKIEEGVIYFKVDGKKRRKLGVSPNRARPVAGSYNETNNILTLIQYTSPQNNQDYVNQQWEIQEDPYNGEIVFAYNDGPLEDGGQLGPFYELESSSPAAFLEPNEKLTHHHSVFHFSGSHDHLNQISKQVLGVELQEIVEAF